MDDQAAVAYLRHRRATHFFGDAGPSLPAGVTARWRLTPRDPRGWHANMVGFIDGPAAHLQTVLDIACAWFEEHGVDCWVDLDERGILFRHQDLLAARGFTLRDDWDAMICRQLVALPPPPCVTVVPVSDDAGLALAAWLSEQNDASRPLVPADIVVQRRLRRYQREQADWNTRFVVAYLDGEPAGTARITDEQLPVIVGVATLPAARGRGVATAITAVLAERALASHAACALYVERGSQAQRIYRRLGFQSLFRCRTWSRPRRVTG